MVGGESSCFTCAELTDSSFSSITVKDGDFMRLQTLAFAGVMAALGSRAEANWEVKFLTAVGGATSSSPRGVSANGVVGSSFQAGTNRATFWSFFSRTPIDYTPAGATSALLYGTSQSQKVGMATFGGQNRACLWETAGARGHINLHPASAIASTALGCDDNQQVGFATFTPGISQAAIWHGTSASWASLHPAGTNTSQAFSVKGGTQVGYAEAGGIFHAARWQGASNTFVDLHPPTAASSLAYGVGTSSIVGEATFGSNPHAVRWDLANNSWIDLHPSGNEPASTARGVSGDVIIGYTGNFPTTRACAWTGPSSVYEDLHQWLPGQYTSSEARAVWVDASGTYITGIARTSSNVSEPIVWFRP